MKSILLRTVSFLALAASFALPASAQCLQPDNLDNTTVCGPAQTSVPQKPFQQQALGICWAGCSVGTTLPYTVQWSAPALSNLNSAGLASCAWYTARVRLLQGINVAWDGTVQMTYARTWAEANTAGTANQVWRFLVNGDLRMASGNVASPCGIPACAPAFNGNMRVTGYIDYQFDCAASVWRRSWMLHHACDSIDHVPGYPRAGAFHPGRSYTWVGPAAGFVPGAGATLEAGVNVSESLRRWDASVMPARCGAEEPIAVASINPQAMTCMCGGGPSNYYEGILNVNGAWGTTISTFPGAAPFRSFPIGSWTNPAVFPGVEEVRWNFNEATFVDCTGVGRNEAWFGVTTAGGDPAFSLNTISPSAPLPLTFIDQCNSVVLPAGFATRNRIFRSDHVLNLNL